MAFNETAKRTVDQVRKLPSNLLEKANKFKNATALALLMAVGGAATDAASQTTYIDTIPEEHKNLCLVYVTDDLLETLNMTTEEFYEQKVKQDFEHLNRTHYYSANTNDINQVVEIVSGDQVQELSTEGLPNNRSAGDGIEYLINEDGIRDNVLEDEECSESQSVILYDKTSNKGVNGSKYIVVKGDMIDGARAVNLLHEMGHRYDLHHYGDDNHPESTWPTQIDTITPRVGEFIEANKDRIPSGDWLKGKRTIMNAGPQYSLYSSPYIRTPDSKSDGIRHIRETLATFDPLLEANILAPADSLEVNEMATLEADLNRDEIEEYEFNWTVRQDGQVVHTGTGATLNYMPTDTGMIEIELFAQKACGGQAAEKTMQLNVVDGTTSVDNTYLNAIKLGPNPTNGMVELIGDTHTLDAVRIYTQEGLPLVELDGNVQFINFDRWPAGMYHLQLIGQDGAVANKKVVKVQ